jgi:hypothetical protein
MSIYYMIGFFVKNVKINYSLLCKKCVIIVDMKNKKMNFCVNDESEGKLRKLKAVKNLTMSDLIRRAIDLLFEKEIGSEK